MLTRICILYLLDGVLCSYQLAQFDQPSSITLKLSVLTFSLNDVSRDESGVLTKPPSMSVSPV